MVVAGPAALGALHREDGPYGGGGFQTQCQVVTAGTLQSHQRRRKVCPKPILQSTGHTGGGQGMDFLVNICVA